jgi:hypothetical protein
MQPTIKDLRRQGYKVRVIHCRPVVEIIKFSGILKEVSAKGGTTRIEITTPDKQHDAFGEAVCSNQDNFNRKTGNSIALGRALKQLQDLKA